MSEPTRWKDSADAPADLRRLLRESATPPLPDTVRAAVRGALPSPPAPGEVPNARSALEAGTRGLRVARWSGTLALGAVAAAVVVTASRKHPDAAVTTFVAPAQSSAVAVSAPESPALPADSAPATAPIPPPSAQAPIEARAPRAFVALPSEDTLAAENALIGRARRLVGTRDFVAALRLLDDHARQFPQGELAPERDYLRITTLRRAGKNAETVTRGRAYLSTYPTSPHAPAVRAMLSELEGHP